MTTATTASQPKPHPGRIVSWLLRYRDSARLALVLKSVTTVIGALLSLGWTKWLLLAMGKELNGRWVTFQSFASLGGVGDFGISGGVGIRVMQYLARGEAEACRRFLANARSVFLGLAAGFLTGALVLSPWLPRWLNLPESPGSGSMSLLFMAGGTGVALMLLGGYLQTLNYVHGNVVWPVLPSFLFTQAGFAAQYYLATHGAPLWEQYAGYVTLSAVGCVVLWSMLRISHPWLADLRPVRFDFGELQDLVATSFWVYLISVGNYLYVNTDRYLIGQGFGWDEIPAYRNNYRLCELAVTVIATASYVGVPAMVRRLLSLDAGERAHGLRGVQRLQKFQIFAACFVAGSYLFFNDLFMRLWLGKDFLVPVPLQFAFGLNLAIVIGGDLGVQLLGRLNNRAVRTVGLTVACAGLLNLGLSWVAMRQKSIVGIALATVVAQSLSSVFISRHACPLLGVSWRAWNFQTLVLPILFMSAAGLARHAIAPDSLPHVAELAAVLVGLSVALSLGVRLTWSTLLEELKRLRPVRA